MVAAAFIVLLGAFVRAVSGFGYSLISAPLLMFVLEPKSVVMINVILTTTTHLLILFHVRQHIDFRRAGFMCLGSVFGIPPGAYILSRIDPLAIKLVIAVLVIPFSIVLLMGYSHQFKRDTLGCIVSGFLSGLLVASTSLGGPPVALFLSNQGLVKERFVGTLCVFFLFGCLLSIGTFSSMSMITPELLKTVAVLLPTLWLGSFIGIKLLPRVNAALFRKMTPAVVCAAALGIIVEVLVDL